MAIIASDLHGNLSKVQRFLNYLPDEKHVFAGDILDCREPHGEEEQLECLTKLITSDAILLYGNHELNYTPVRIPCSGYQVTSASIYKHYLKKSEDRWQNAYLVDGYIITHAGISDKLQVPKNPTLCVKRLNNNKVNDMYSIGYSRGGSKPNGGIFWYDYLSDYDKLNTNFDQVFGHRPSEFPWEDRQDTYHHVCVNTSENKEEFWVFNTKTKELIEL